MTGPSPSRPPRYWSLDILRGICALTVFLNHWVLWSNFAPLGAAEKWLHQVLAQSYEVFIALAWPVGGQHPAVLCFFVLSGFCVHGMMERRIGRPGPPVDWKDYFSRRARRIMPVYWVAGLIGLLVVAAVWWRPSADPLLLLHTATSPAGLAARLGGYSGLWPDEIFAGNYILATVAVEIVIYVFYPVFYRVAAAGRWWLLGFAAVGLQFMALALWPYVNPFVLFTGVLVMALFWYLGALAVHLREKHGWRVPGWWLGVVWAAFLSLGQVPHFHGLNMIRQAVWGLFCMGLIVWLLDWERRHEDLRERMGIRWLRQTGDLSYALYAVHTPTILLVNWAMLTWIPAPSYSLQLVFNLAACAAVTLAVHVGVERRFYRVRGAG